MSIGKVSIVFACVLGVALLAGVGRTEEVSSDGGCNGMDPALMQPGPEHAAFKSMVGTWSIDGLFWQAPGQEPTKMKSTATFDLILGGRYLQQKIKGAAFMEGGEPFEGLGISGYDKVAGHYFSTWFDNMGTGVMQATGNMSKDGKTLTLTGEGDFGMGKMTFREVHTHVSETEFVMDMYVSAGDQGEMQVMQLRYQKL